MIFVNSFSSQNDICVIYLFLKEGSRLKDRLRQILDEFSLTQVSFAQRLGVQQSTVSMWLNGQREPTETAKRSICHEFNICREWLEDGIEPMHPTQELSDIALITRAMEGQNEHKKELIRMLANMPDELLDKFVEYLKTYLL